MTKKIFRRLSAAFFVGVLLIACSEAEFRGGVGKQDAQTPQQPDTFDKPPLGEDAVASVATPAATTILFNKPTCILTADRTSLVEGQSITVKLVTADTKEASLQGVAVDRLGVEQLMTPPVSGTIVAEVLGDGGVGRCELAYTVIPRPPTCSIVAASTSIPLGSSTNLILTFNGVTSSASLNGNTIATSDATISVSPTTSTTYTLDVNGPGGTGRCSAAVNIQIPAAPTCLLVAQQSTVLVNSDVQLVLTTSGAVTAASFQGRPVDLAGGSFSQRPTTAGTVTYTGGVSGPGGSNTCTAQVVVRSPVAPTCQLSASPSTVALGNSTTLTMTTGGDVATANIDTTPVLSTGGSLAVTPSQPRSYTGTVSGPGGNASCTAMINVTPPPGLVFANVAAVTFEDSNDGGSDWAVRDIRVCLNGDFLINPTTRAIYSTTATPRPLTLFAERSPSAFCRHNFHVEVFGQDNVKKFEGSFATQPGMLAESTTFDVVNGDRLLISWSWVSGRNCYITGRDPHTRTTPNPKPPPRFFYGSCGDFSN